MKTSTEFRIFATHFSLIILWEEEASHFLPLSSWLSYCNLVQHLCGYWAGSSTIWRTKKRLTWTLIVVVIVIHSMPTQCRLYAEYVQYLDYVSRGHVYGFHVGSCHIAATNLQSPDETMPHSRLQNELEARESNVGNDCHDSVEPEWQRALCRSRPHSHLCLVNGRLTAFFEQLNEFSFTTFLLLFERPKSRSTMQ